MENLNNNVNNCITENFENYTGILIHKFMEEKELFLEKNSINGTLIFNEKYEKYLSKIVKVTKILKNQGTINIDNIDFKIESTIELSNEQKESLWIYNKIRDSFCHGKGELTDEEVKLIEER